VSHPKNHALISSLLLAALTLGVAGAARAQEPVVNPLGRLGPNTVVRATLPDGRRLVGAFQSAGMGRLGVGTPSGTTDTLTLAQIRTLEVRGRHTRTGAIVGGVAGVASGVFIGYVIGATCDAAECHRGRAYLYTIPLFGGAGTLLGAVIGAALPKWNRVYP